MNLLRTISGHLCVLAVLVTAGCSKSAPAFVEATVTVSVPADVSTEMLRAFIYDTASGELRGQLFISGREGRPDGTVIFSTTESLRRGTFDIVVYNFDMPDTFIRGEDNIGTLEAYTSEVNDLIKSRYGSDVTSGSRITYTPDKMIVARIIGANITEGAVISGEALPVVSSTDLALNAEGLEWSNSRSAVASGFATTWFLGAGRAGDKGRLYFDLLSDGNASMIASVPSFGEISDNYDFVFNVTTADGSYNFTATTDKTFRFNKSILIPKPDDGQGNNGGSGFSPQVGQWKDIPVDIPVI